MFPDIESSLDAKIVHEIISSTVTGFVGQLLVLLFALLFTAGYVPTAILTGWVLLHLLNFLLRYRIVQRYLRAVERDDKPFAHRLFRGYLTSLATTSLLWAAMPLGIFWLPEEYHFLLYALIISLTFGSTMSIGPLTPVFMIYVLPMNLVMMGVLLYEGGRVHVAAALFLPVAFFFAARAARMHLMDYTVLLTREHEATSLKEFFEHRAHHDALTGIPNRFKFFERFRHRLDEAKKEERPLALFFLDLDRFKQINDTYGHAAGDRVLEVVGQRLQASLRKEDLPARFAGDEFVAIVEGIGDREHLEQIALKIRETIASPIAVDGVTLSVTPSIGIARYPEDGDEMEELLKKADEAMYRSKRAGCPFAFYT